MGIKKVNTNHFGFTLIELLVVVAIIGILSSVVLASLNSARSKGADAAIKANASGIRTLAEAYYSEMGRYASVTSGSDYTGDCLTTATMFRETVITGPARDIADRITESIDKSYQLGNGGKQCRINGPRTLYLIALQLKGSNNYWCIDTTGYSGDIGSSLPTAGAMTCN